MNNRIIDRENSEENLIKLAVKNHLHSKAKNILGIQIVTQVILVIALALLSTFITNSFLKSHNIKKEQFNTFTVGLSFILVVSNLIIMIPIINKAKELAASIQESYDCTVLSIQWNDIKADKPDGQIISCNANEYIKAKLAKTDSDEANRRTILEGFKNWYSPEEIKGLPIEAGRIICQRTNCWWDSYLRNKFRRDLVICSSSIFFVLLLIGIIREISISTILINMISPFASLLTFTIVQFSENTKSIKCTEKLKIKADEYWEKVIYDPTNFTLLNDISIKLQTEIFYCRKNSPLIFDWYYNKYKNEQQINTDFKARTMIKQYNSAI